MASPYKEVTFRDKKYIIIIRISVVRTFKLYLIILLNNLLYYKNT